MRDNPMFGFGFYKSIALMTVAVAALIAAVVLFIKFPPERMMIAGVVSFFAVLIWDAESDARKPVIKHRKEAWLRMGLLIPSGILLTIGHPGMPAIALGVIPMMFFVYWFLFDGLYNLFRDEPWWFTGTIDEDESKTDNFIRWVGLYWSKVLKIGGSVGTVAIYVLTYIF